LSYVQTENFERKTQTCQNDTDVEIVKFAFTFTHENDTDLRTFYLANIGQSVRVEFLTLDFDAILVGEFYAEQLSYACEWQITLKFEVISWN
jgi:hypothetical protein